MKVIGVDQSYRSSGIVILDDDKIIHCERYVTDPLLDIYDRAAILADHLTSLTLEYKPEKIALEGLSFGSKGNVTRDLGGLLFTLILTLRSIGYAPVVLPPTTVKKVATGKGNSKKDAMITSLPKDARERFDELGVKKTTGLSDLADAYWIGRTVLQI